MTLGRIRTAALSWVVNAQTATCIVPTKTGSTPGAFAATVECTSCLAGVGCGPSEWHGASDAPSAESCRLHCRSQAAARDVAPARTKTINQVTSFVIQT